MNRIRKTSYVLSSLIVNGELSFDPEVISDSVVQFYTELFNAQNHDTYDDTNLRDFILLVIDLVDNDMLTALPSGEEIKRAVFDMEPSSSPGPDGFDGSFYQACWDVIDFDVIEAVYFGSVVTRRARNFMINTTGITAGSLSFSHLGVPIFQGAPRTYHLAALADSIISKFSKWKGHSLYFAGRKWGVPHNYGSISSIWPGIRRHLGRLVDGSRWVVGLSLRISFWNDNWLGYIISDKLGIPSFFTCGISSAFTFLETQIVGFEATQSLASLLPEWPTISFALPTPGLTGLLGFGVNLYPLVALPSPGGLFGGNSPLLIGFVSLCTFLTRLLFAGAIFRNSHGFFIAAFTKTVGWGYPLEAELASILHAILFTFDRGWHSLWVESDSILKPPAWLYTKVLEASKESREFSSAPCQQQGRVRFHPQKQPSLSMSIEDRVKNSCKLGLQRIATANVSAESASKETPGVTENHPNIHAARSRGDTSIYVSLVPTSLGASPSNRNGDPSPRGTNRDTQRSSDQQLANRSIHT
ncbi:hypothetical protein ACS0TY_021769 [Phlomoides rotata]